MPKVARTEESEMSKQAETNTTAQSTAQKPRSPFELPFAMPVMPEFAFMRFGMLPETRSPFKSLSDWLK